jgi:hypothetical protein
VAKRVIEQPHAVRQTSGRYPPSPVPVQRCTSRTGRSAGVCDARSRPGTVCETVRGDRTCSTFRIASGMCPSMSKLTDIWHRKKDLSRNLFQRIVIAESHPRPYRMPSSATVSSVTFAACRSSSVSRVRFQPPCANQHTDTNAAATLATGKDHQMPVAWSSVCFDRT